MSLALKRRVDKAEKSWVLLHGVLGNHSAT